MSTQMFMGQVQWFNKKRGCGFIRVGTPDVPETGQDYFCHYTSIQTSNYKTLYPGEYVSFNLDMKDNKQICTHVTGIYGNSLLIDNDTHIYKVIPKRDNVAPSWNGIEMNNIVDENDAVTNN